MNHPFCAPEQESETYQALTRHIAQAIELAKNLRQSQTVQHYFGDQPTVLYKVLLELERARNTANSMALMFHTPPPEGNELQA